MHRPSETQRQHVKALSGYGMTHKHISSFIGINEDTLRAHYRAELDEGMSQAVATAAKGLYKKIQDGNLTAIIFYLKTKGGFRETSEPVAVPDSAKSDIVRMVTVSTKEELERLEAAKGG